MKFQFIKVILILFTSLFLLQCGEEDPELAKVEIESLPESPFVRTTNTKISESITYAKNWFRFSLKINNESSKYLTIVGVKAKVYDNTGQVAKEVEFDPAQIEFIGLPNNLYFEVIAPGQTSTDLGAIAFVVDGVSDLAIAGSYAYRVEITPIGWFGQYDSPDKRISKQVTIITQ